MDIDDFELKVPTIYGMRCAHCGSANIRVRKLKQGYGMAVSPGELVAPSTAELCVKHSAVFEKSLNPIACKCADCKKAFTTLPVAASPDDLLEQPCTIRFQRVRANMGAPFLQLVVVNGICLMPTFTPQTVSVQSPLRHNTVFVNGGGKAFEGVCSFEAMPGEVIDLCFGMKFLAMSKGSLEPPSGYSAYSDPAALERSKQANGGLEQTKKTPLRSKLVFIGIVLVVAVAIGIPAWILYSDFSAKTHSWEQGIREQPKAPANQAAQQ
jgi:hypothetical protein